MTRREDIVELLKEREWTAEALADYFDTHKRVVEDDLEHIFKSLKRKGLKLVIRPAYCDKCGFRFAKGKIKTPSKCPKCNNENVVDAVFKVD